MSVTPGRNALCPCGSGLKYKKCHLLSGESLPGVVPPPPPPRPTPLPVISPPLPSMPATAPDLDLSVHDPAGEWYVRFHEATDATAALAVVREALRSRQLHEDTFELLGDARDRLLEEGRRADFRSLLDQLRLENPEDWARDAVWYQSWLIEDLIVLHDFSSLPALIPSLTRMPLQDIDEFLRVVDSLLYHDQAEATLPMLREAWPLVAGSADILDIGRAEVAALLTALTLYAHVESGRLPRADDPELLNWLERATDVDTEQVQASIDALTGAPRAWTRDDFRRSPQAMAARAQKQERKGDTLRDVAVEMGLEKPKRDKEKGAARGGWPDDAKIDEAMARLDARAAADGELDDDDAFEELEEMGLFSGLEDDEQPESEPEPTEPEEIELRRNLLVLTLAWAAWNRRERGIPFARTEVARETLVHYLTTLPPERDGRARLLPDRDSLNKRLAALMSIFSGQHYRAGALYALMPAWLDFLVELGLATPSERHDTLSAIAPLRADVRRIVEEATGDRDLVQAIREAGK